LTDELREPLIKAPWPAVALPLAIVGAYGAQVWAGSDALIARYGVTAAAVRGGDYAVLVTGLFLHGGWAHALGNAAFCLAFATPVARRMGPGAQAAALFFICYLLCGMASNMVLVLCHWRDDGVAVGASGAVAGLMGAASRMVTREPRLASFTNPTVLSMAGAWIAINLLFGLLLSGWAPGAGGMPIAWQAHLAGYAMGLFLIGPMLRMLGRS